MSYICRFMFASLWFVNIQQKGKIGVKKIYIKIWPKVKLNHGNVFESAVCTVYMYACMHVQYIVANKNAFLCCEFLFLSSVFAHSSYFCGQFFVAPTILWFSFFCWVYNRKTHVASISHFYLLPVRIVVTEYELWLLFATIFFCSDQNANSEERKKECLKNRKYCELYVSFIFYFSQNKCSEPQKNPYNFKRKICMWILSRFCRTLMCAVRTDQCAFIYNGFVSFGHARLCPVFVNNKIWIFS